MLGGLHIETHGNVEHMGRLFRGIRHTQEGITSSTAADSFLKAAHLTRTRHAHLSTLYSTMSSFALCQCGTTWWEQKRGLKTSNDQQEFNILILGYCLQNGNSGSDICLSSQRTRLSSLSCVESLKALVPCSLLLTIRTIPDGFPSTSRM